MLLCAKGLQKVYFHDAVTYLYWWKNICCIILSMLVLKRSALLSTMNVIVKLYMLACIACDHWVAGSNSLKRHVSSLILPHYSLVIA